MLLLSLGLFSWGPANKDGFIARVGLCKLLFPTLNVPLGFVVRTGKEEAPISQAQHLQQAPEFCVASTTRILASIRPSETSSG